MENKNPWTIIRGKLVDFHGKLSRDFIFRGILSGDINIRGKSVQGFHFPRNIVCKHSKSVENDYAAKLSMENLNLPRILWT